MYSLFSCPCDSFLIEIAAFRSKLPKWCAHGGTNFTLNLKYKTNQSSSHLRGDTGSKVCAAGSPGAHLFKSGCEIMTLPWNWEPYYFASF